MIGLGSTAPRQFAFTTRAHAAVDDATGEPIGLDDVDTRVGWLLDLIAAAGGELVSRLWQPVTFEVLAAGRDGAGRRLPAQGHVAAARLGWNPHYPTGVYVPSRVTRVVTAQVMTSLRTLAYRDTAITALSERFDPPRPRSVPPQPQHRAQTDCPRIIGASPTMTAASGRNWRACRPRGRCCTARPPG